MNQRDVYTALKYYNDARSIVRAFQTRSLTPILRRVGRRAYGKASGRLAGRIFG